MIKVGDWIEDKVTLKLYRVKMIRKGTVLLETEGGFGRILTSCTTIKAFYQIKSP